MPRTSRLLAALNPEQREAAETIEGPLLVLAGGGTGKTRVVTTRIAHMVAQGVDPGHILAVTFTNKAAKEMRERLGRLIGTKAESLVASTFHSFCLRFLREHPDSLGMERGFSICDPSDQLAFVTRALRSLHVPAASLKPRDALSLISLAKNRLEDPDALARRLDPDLGHLAARTWEKYQDSLQHACKLDFDDLLLETRRLLKDPKLRAEAAQRHRFVLVDEYQDTNAPQFEIVKAITEEHRNLCVVGDDDQSIYSWRGADMTKILSFKKTFGGAKVITLETNYRSTETILRCANRLIQNNTKRHEKTLRSALGEGEPVSLVTMRDEEIEANKVVQRIDEMVQAGHKLDEFAVLFRTAIQARTFEAELRLRDIPYTLVGGMSFFDRKEVRDVMAYLRLLVDPDDEQALLRILNSPPRGIGKSTLDRVTAYATSEGISVGQAFDQAEHIKGVKVDRCKPIQQLRLRLRTLRGLYPDSSKNLVKLVKQTIGEVDYEEEVRRCYRDEEEYKKRWEGVEEVLNAAQNHAQRHKHPGLQRFLDELLLSAEDRDDPEDSSKRLSVTLMTLHASKGLEFPQVFLVGMEEGCLPHLKSVQEDSIEEERRLAYVGITRAQKFLQLSWCQTRARGGQTLSRHISRFLLELQQREPPSDWVAAGAEPAPKRKTKGRRRRARR